MSNLQLEKTQTPSALPVHIARTPFSATTTPKNEDLLRNLCDASFSDTLSMTSSVSSRGSLIPRRSPAVQLMCMGCNVSFGTVFQRILCSRCTKHFCEGCSTTSETTHYGMVYQQRVCSGCLDVLPDTPFTPGTVHLEEASSVASSLPSGEVNRNVAARLWSGGTTFSEFSVGVSSSIGISQGSSGNIRLSEEEEEESDDEQNISMDSITENLIDIIQEESITVSAQPVQVSDFETEAENANAVLSDSNEGDARGVEVKREADDSSFVVNDVDPVREDAQLQKKEEDVSVQVHFPVRPLKVQRLLAVALVLCVLLSALLWMPLYEYVASEPALLGVQEQPFLVQVQQTVVKAASEPVVLLVQQASSAESSDDQCTTDKAKELGSSQPSAPDAPVALVAAALTNVSTAESSSSGPVVTAHQVVAARIPQLFKSLLRMVVSKFQSLLDKVIMDGLRLFGRLKVKQAT